LGGNRKASHFALNEEGAKSKNGRGGYKGLEAKKKGVTIQTSQKADKGKGGKNQERGDDGEEAGRRGRGRKSGQESGENAVAVESST